MEHANHSFNRGAANLQPDELVWPSGKGCFALPDFRDAVEAAEPPEPELEHGTIDVPESAEMTSAHVAPIAVLEPVQALDEAVAGPTSPIEADAAAPFEGLLASPDLLTSAPAIERPERSGQILLAPLLSSIVLDCEPLLRRLAQLLDSPAHRVTLVCDTDDGLRAAIAASALAAQIAGSTEGEILLVDSGLEQGELTGWLGAEELGGTREFLRAMSAWQAVASPTDIPRLSFMPCGRQKLRFSETSGFVDSVLRKALAQMAERYRHVLVCCGTAFDNSLFAWRGFCSGTVVTLDTLSSSRSIAQAAIRELNAAGCRVMGCLPTPCRGLVKTPASDSPARAA